MTTYRIEGFFRLKSPLSHIGETISNKSYLVQERILQRDGTLEEVFCYSGNAWRGQLRDLCAAYMLDKFGGPRLPVDAFHLLFSGGRIGGTQNTDIAQARRLRAAVPVLALFGGGVGSQILQGKLRIGNCYPICREAIPVLPASVHDQAERIDYADCTGEKEHSRRDDAKIENIRTYLAEDNALLLEGGSGKAKEKSGPADQMRIGMEVVNAGVTLASWIVVEDASEVELGALVSGLHRFSERPQIGGKVGIGYGSVDLRYSLRGPDWTLRDFLSISDGISLLSPEAARAKDSYDQHLRSIYDGYISDNSKGITALLGAS